MWIKWFVLSYYSRESCHLFYQYIHASDLVGFSAHVQKFSRLLNKFEVWVSCEAVCDIFNRFFCLIFKIEFNPLQDLQNTGLTIIEIGLFYGSSKNMQIPDFFFDKITSRWQLLVGI